MIFYQTYYIFIYITSFFFDNFYYRFNMILLVNKSFIYPFFNILFSNNNCLLRFSNSLIPFKRLSCAGSDKETWTSKLENFFSNKSKVWNSSSEFEKIKLFAFNCLIKKFLAIT